MTPTHSTLPVLARLLFLVALLLPSLGSATTVRMQTNLGPIDFVLYDTAAPRTVANFLAYVNSNAYRNSFVHRSVPGFIIQGGGFAWSDPLATVVNVGANPPVANEFSSSRSNKRGTIAMAKLGNDPNSATSQWFVNLADNASILDGQNGGFTVFGEVSAASMPVVDAIARLPLVNAGGAFGELPIVGNIANNNIAKSNLVLVSATTAVTNNFQGLWWNANESGWGMSITQHGNILFVAVYTYDDSGAPIWYAISNCPVVGTGCTGELFKVEGGRAPNFNWAGANLVLTKVGTGTLAFNIIGNATFDFTINNVVGRKNITPQIFATGTTAPAVNYTDLWWNPNESGWGVSLTQQFGTIFAAWYTYDTAGKPLWYVATNCPVVGNGCTSRVGQVSSGTALTAPWRGIGGINDVGGVTFTFSDAANGLMSYTINGVTTSRVIARQNY